MRLYINIDNGKNRILKYLMGGVKNYGKWEKDAENRLHQAWFPDAVHYLGYSVVDLMWLMFCGSPLSVSIERNEQ